MPVRVLVIYTVGANRTDHEITLAKAANVPQMPHENRLIGAGCSLIGRDLLEYLTVSWVTVTLPFCPEDSHFCSMELADEVCSSQKMGDRHMAQQTSKPSLWKTLNTKQQTQVILFWLLAIAALVGFVSAFQDGHLDWRGLGENLSSELFGGVIAFVVFEYVLERREKDDLKQQLIRQMRSKDNLRAGDAIRELYAHGWMKDGSLQGITMLYANLQEVGLYQANLIGAYFAGANLQKANLNEANLQEVRFAEVALQGANLALTNLQKASFWKANLQGANLSGANLQEASISQTNLQRANLSDANLQEAELLITNLQEVILKGASLKGADLRNANLKGADLRAVDLRGANLRGASLQGVNFFDDPVIGAPLYDENIILPDGMSWTPSTDMKRFTNPEHPDFWRVDYRDSPAYRGDEEEEE
jgi:uncharacterized protein YjbI with pentapeptide repeats